MQLNLVAISERLYHNPYGIDYKGNSTVESIIDTEYITTVEAGMIYKVYTMRHNTTLDKQDIVIRYVVIPK